MTQYSKVLSSVTRIFKALSDENRIRTVLALQNQELCVCQIVELLHLAPSTVSKHMSILKNAGLVNSTKKGRWVYYKLSSDYAPTEIKQTVDWALEAIQQENVQQGIRTDNQIEFDRESLQEILNMDPEMLCRKQNEC